jgi:serine/threonine-protein kinase
MSTKDAILGHVCVERGWMSEPQLEECLKECHSLSHGRPAPDSEVLLPRVLLRRHLIPEMELEALRVEIDKVLRSGAPGDGAEDLRLLKVLLRDARVSREYVDQAMARQRELLANGHQARVVEILLEGGHLTLAALEEAFHALHLCKACTGELVPAGAKPAPAPSPSASAKETDDKNSSSALLPSVGESAPKIGRYQSLKEIGRGGMGRVYKAWDEPHQRWVALKVISDKLPLEGLTRFRREVEISRSLHHPHIVAVYEVATVQGKHLISMQYVDGGTLERERPAPRKAAQIIATLAHALQYAHSRGIIHRDLKPQNLMLDRAGKPYLMDFGMARSMDNASSVTAVGTAMGTPSYMSPEMALGRSGRVDRRSDVYSLGAVLYTLATGQPPFRGANPVDTIQKVARGEVLPPTALVPGLSPALETVILTCLRKERNDRYQSAKQFAEELERILPGLPG